MHKDIKNSVALVNNYLIYVLLIAVLGIDIYPGPLHYFTYIGHFTSHIFNVILYSMLVCMITKHNKSTAVKALKEHFLNYIIVILIAITPIYIIGQLGRYLSLNEYAIVFLTTISTLIISILLIYILPLVFLKRENIKAITAGISCLVTNLQHSKHLIMLMFLAFFSSLIPTAILMFITLSSIYNIIPSMIVFSIITTYIYAIIFSAASITLLNNYEALQEKP